MIGSQPRPSFQNGSAATAALASAGFAAAVEPGDAVRVEVEIPSQFIADTSSDWATGWAAMLSAAEGKAAAYNSLRC